MNKQLYLNYVIKLLKALIKAQYGLLIIIYSRMVIRTATKSTLDETINVDDRPYLNTCI